MLTPSQIVRLIDSRDHRRVVDRLMCNGRCHSRLAREALHRAESLMPAAIGLGLQRVCELSYRAVPEGADLSHRLQRLQRRDGLFGPPHSISNADELLAATAVATRGLIDWSSNFEHREDEQTLLQHSIERGLAALAVAWRGGSSAHADASWAVVLWQLGDSDLASQRLPNQTIRKHLLRAAPELLADDLTRLALTMAA